MKILKFPEMSDEWLDLIAQCRNGKTHNYDIVEGPMADDTVWNYVNDFLTGRISRKQFWINLFHSLDIQRWLRGLKYC
ncbi:DUF3990 domain-containing protein [Anaerostipes hadrus]|nr:DUF3990 domain-containing protein [Anaerostipes hadrus]NSH30877.1 DUF3990 domain-containing protein [Anaerostipes hadrus]NSJ72628.1 DUF3990 domain-containing protein [Anaerostipes hadrus]